MALLFAQIPFDEQNKIIFIYFHSIDGVIFNEGLKVIRRIYIKLITLIFDQIAFVVGLNKMIFIY